MGQIFSGLKWKRETTESEDQNQARKVLVIQDPNNEVQSNSTTRTTLSTSQSGWDYDVFLSFRGEDTRKNFTDHLYSALMGVGIRTFRDNEELQRGENISTELLNAIHGSRISIVIFSEGYASSRWCLDELVEIVCCRSIIGHTLLPIFYHVNPSDVRHQIETFVEVFARHEKRFQTDMERVRRWRAALTEAASCSGWNLNNVADGYESRFIKEIVEEVWCKLNPALLNVAKHPIGMKSRVDDIKVLLNLGTRDVRVVGIYGMGGIGKTSLAKAVYNEICDAFEGNSFLLNLKESSEKPDGLIHLQNQLLSDILKMNSKIVNVDRGTNIIQHRIQGKKVLVILDDVDDFGNLHMLVEKHWLGSGSRIIITTRDEHLLTQLGVDEKYEVQELNHWESLRLFSWHAFKMYNPRGEYLVLSIEVVDYIGGLPLALEVLGSFLKERTIAEWKSELKKLRRTPNEKIQKILGISFNSLDTSTKDIFLDIACFFVDMDKEYVSIIFDSCNFFPGIGIPILIQRSLVTIDYQNKLKMHNLIRDMGRKIVCEESHKYPGKRSRLWFYEDVLNVLHKPTGSETVEGLILNLPVLEDIDLKTEAFKNMTNLRLLQINDVHLTGSYEHLSKELKWLCWHNCPMKFLPQDFHLENLVILDMQHSKVKLVWEDRKILFKKLKVLNLSNSKYLTRSPDFSQVPQLEILILEGCTSLVQVHESIGHLKRLDLLNLKNCTKLKYLPRSIFNLESLKTLDLSGCSAFEKLPEQLQSSLGLSMTNLKTTSFFGCSSLIELPNFSHTPHLESLELGNCISLVEVHESIGHLKRLVFLNLKNCTKLKYLPRSIFNLESLETLDLSGCSAFEKLPNQLQSSPGLSMINLKIASFCGCSSLIELPNFSHIPHLESLKLQGCRSLVEVHESIGHLKRLFSLNLESCEKLRNLPNSISNIESLKTLYLRKCINLKTLPEQLGNMTALIILDVSFTAIKQLPPSFRLLRNLIRVSFSGCQCLIESPEFSQTSCIKDLTFENCTSLVKIHESIGHLKELRELDFSGCKKLRGLPISSTSNLESLESLILSNCSELDKLPEQRENMMALSKLVADGTAIGQMPLSLGLLSGRPISPKSSNRIGNNFHNLPSCISRLPKLLVLILNECTTLQSISIPRSVMHLEAKGCTSLERISVLTNESSGSSDLDYLDDWSEIGGYDADIELDNCHKLVEIQNLESLLRIPNYLIMEGCKNLSSDFRESVFLHLLKTMGETRDRKRQPELFLPGSEIPNWITHQTIGSSISFRVPPLLEGKIRKVLLCVVYAINKETPRDILARGYLLRWKWRFCNKSSRDQSNNWETVPDAYFGLDFFNFEDQIFALKITDSMWIERLQTSGDEIEFAVDLKIWDQGIIRNSKIMEVKRCGIHLWDP